MNCQLTSFERGEIYFKVMGLTDLELKKVFICDLRMCIDAITNFNEYLKMDEITKKPVIVLEGVKGKEKYSIIYDNKESVKVVGQNIEGLNDSNLAYALEAIASVLISMNVLYAVSGLSIIVEKLKYDMTINSKNKPEKLNINF